MEIESLTLDILSISISKLAKFHKLIFKRQTNVVTFLRSPFIKSNHVKAQENLYLKTNLKISDFLKINTIYRNIRFNI